MYAVLHLLDQVLLLSAVVGLIDDLDGGEILALDVGSFYKTNEDYHEISDLLFGLLLGNLPSLRKLHAGNNFK